MGICMEEESQRAAVDKCLILFAWKQMVLIGGTVPNCENWFDHTEDKTFECFPAV